MAVRRASQCDQIACERGRKGRWREHTVERGDGVIYLYTSEHSNAIKAMMIISMLCVELSVKRSFKMPGRSRNSGRKSVGTTRRARLLSGSTTNRELPERA